MRKTIAEIALLLSMLLPAGAAGEEKGGEEKAILEKIKELTKTEKLTIEGKAFIRYWYYINDSTVEEPGEEEAHENTFELWRFYLGMRSRLARWLTIRFTADVGPEKTGVKTSEEENHVHEFDGDQSYQLFVKYAWFDVEPLGGLHLRCGVIENPYHYFINNFWGYRYVSKNLGHELGLYNSADVGAYMRFELPGKLGDIYTGIANGAGYKNALDTDENKELWVNIMLAPLAPLGPLFEKLFIGGFLQYPAITERGLGRELLIGGFAGLSHPWITVGYQPLFTYSKEAETEAVSQGLGHAVYFRFDTPIKVGILSRFGVWDADRFDDEKRAKYSLLAGASYSPLKLMAVAASCLVAWESGDGDPETQEPEKEVKFLISTQFEY